jgi:hypothetical protein
MFFAEYMTRGLTPCHVFCVMFFVGLAMRIGGKDGIVDGKET